MRPARITGIDLAFALTLPVIIYYGYHLELGQNRDTFLRDQFHLIFDGAVAIFLFLIGFTTGIAGATYQGIKQVQRYIAIRGIFFVAFGLLLNFFWPSNLFVLLGVSSILLSILLPLHSTFMYFLGAIIAIMAVVFNLFTDLSTNLLPWKGFPAGTIMSIIRDGYYGILPWMFFVLAGTVYSRTDFLRASHRNFKIVVGLLLIGLAMGFEFLGEKMLRAGAISAYNPFTEITVLHLLMPSFLLAGLGMCVAIFNICLQISDQFMNSPILVVLRRFGKMKYSILLFQAIAGILAGLMLTGLETFGAQTIILFSILVSVGSVVFASLWMKRFDAGPVELILNALTGRK